MFQQQLQDYMKEITIRLCWKQDFKPKESELKKEPPNAYLQKEYLHATSFKGDITFLGQRM